MKVKKWYLRIVKRFACLDVSFGIWKLGLKTFLRKVVFPGSLNESPEDRDLVYNQTPRLSKGLAIFRALRFILVTGMEVKGGPVAGSGAGPQRGGRLKWLAVLS